MHASIDEVEPRSSSRGSTAAALIVLAVCLSACGGGDKSVPTLSAQSAVPLMACAPPPEGSMAPFRPAVVGGAMIGRDDPSFILVASPDSSKWLLFYGPDLSSESRLTGYVYAAATQSGLVFQQ